MELLNKAYLGNTLQDWLIAVCLWSIVFAALVITRRVLVSRLSSVAAATDNKIDDLLVGMIKNTKLFILLIVSAYATTYSIALNDSMAAFWRKVLILTLIVQGALWASAGLSLWFDMTIQKRADQDTSSVTTIRFLGFLARILLWTIVLLLILDNLGVNITGLVAGLGIGGVAVALAVQNILGDLLASLSIVLDKPFVIGDFVVVDDLSGAIEHIGLKTTRIRSIGGEQLIFSNNDLLKSRIRNYKRMTERRIAFCFGVVYQTPLEKLKAIKGIVVDIFERTDNARLDRVHFKEYAHSSLNFEVVYFVSHQDYKIYMDVQEAINLEIFRRFQEEGIEFAYPTQTIFIQPKDPEMHETL